MKSKTLDQIFAGRRRRHTPIVAQFPGGTCGALEAYMIFPPNTLGHYSAHPVTWIDGRWVRSSLSKSLYITVDRAVHTVK